MKRLVQIIFLESKVTLTLDFRNRAKNHVIWAARSGVMATFIARAKWMKFAGNVNLFSLPGKMSQGHIQNITIVKPIPDICHEPTSEARVNFFWPV